MALFDTNTAADLTSAPVEVPLTDTTTGNFIQDVSTPDAGTLGSINYPNTDNSGWGGLDVLGSAVSNVASSVLTSAGHLVAAQVNNAALLTATGRRAAPLGKQPASNPNAWHGWVLGAVAALGLGGLVWVAARRA